MGWFTFRWDVSVNFYSVSWWYYGVGRPTWSISVPYGVDLAHFWAVWLVIFLVFSHRQPALYWLRGQHLALFGAIIGSPHCPPLLVLFSQDFDDHFISAVRLECENCYHKKLAWPTSQRKKKPCRALLLENFIIETVFYLIGWYVVSIDIIFDFWMSIAELFEVTKQIIKKLI